MENKLDKLVSRWEEIDAKLEGKLTFQERKDLVNELKKTGFAIKKIRKSLKEV